MGDVPLDLPVASALIGRAAELDRLAALTGLDDKEPRAAAVLLSGDAGIGKTRLMSALRALPRDLAGCCWCASISSTSRPVRSSGSPRPPGGASITTCWQRWPGSTGPLSNTACATRSNGACWFPPVRTAAPSGMPCSARLAPLRAEHLRLRWLVGTDVPDEREFVQTWEQTVAAFERYPHVFEHARSQTRLAAVLRSTGEAGRAREDAESARDKARRLGAAPLLAELEALVPVAADRRHASRRPDEALTPHEQEVLALVAEGRSNREIADRLYISAKTVSVHVSNILSKLAAGGRTEAVAIARRRGLLKD